MKLSLIKVKENIVHFFTTGNWITRPAVFLPVVAVVVASGLLLTLGVTKFQSMGFLEQDCFAVSEGSLANMLTTEKKEDSVQLIKLSQGDALYSSILNSKEYYVGEDHATIGASYPLYTRQGQVLYFLGNEMNLITEDWETYETYQGLYLSDGTSYNTDGSTADENIMLVEVNGGYVLGQKAKITQEGESYEIPMNTICGFLENSIEYLQYINGRLDSCSGEVSEEDLITIGDVTLTYQEFREYLGLWKQKASIPDNNHEDEEENSKKESNKDIINGEEEKNSGEAVPTNEERNDKKEPKGKEGDHEASKTGTTNPGPSNVIKNPDPAKENPNATPVAPTDTDVETDSKDPDYVTPTVTIGENITSWVYTLGIDVQVNDPAARIKQGIKVTVYQVLTGGKEKVALRKTVGGSGEVDLGQLEPGVKYHLTASFTYRNEKNLNKTVDIEIGRESTQPFNVLGEVKVSFYGEDSWTSHPGTPEVEIFSNKIQLRNIRFDNISNGKYIEVDNKVVTHTNIPIKNVETYVNDFIVTAVNRSDSSVKVFKMDSAALRWLREGYTVYNWETAETLDSGTEYIYSIMLQDRFGNTFLTAGNTMDGGHTCKNLPTVEILVPDKSNKAASTEIDIHWKNRNMTTIGANTDTTAMMGSTVAGLYLVPAGATVSPENAIELEGYPLGQSNSKVTGVKFLPINCTTSSSTQIETTRWVITNLPTTKTYTAAVLIGYADIEDGKVHKDITIEDTTSFMSASLATLGTISYSTEVSNTTMTGVDLAFRMNKANTQLLPLLDSITLTLTGNNVTQKVTFYKKDLTNVPLGSALQLNTTTNLYEGEYSGIPVYLDGAEKSAGTTTLSLSGRLIPTLPDSPAPENLWDYLLATSNSLAKDDCYLSFTVGDELVVPEGSEKAYLIKTEPSTYYQGMFITKAKQGGEEYDLTNYSGNSIIFKTKSETAKVFFDNALAFDTFIELYNLSIEDPGEAIINDGKNPNGDIVIQILDSHNLIVKSTYIKSTDTYRTMHIGGLEINKSYKMMVKALVYQNEQATETFYPLEYADPQSDATPTIYEFVTGENVSGDISLKGVSQLYDDEVGGMTDNLSILQEGDFYYGYYTSGNTIYYYGGTDGKDRTQLEIYLNESKKREKYDAAKAFAEMEYNSYKSASTGDGYKNGTNWTTCLIPCNPGEQYVIYNTEYDGSGVVTFFYENASDGKLYYYTQYSGGYLNRGGVFEVPSPSLGYNQTSMNIRYMRISGANIHNSTSMILEKYNPTKTKNRTNLAQGLSYTKGVVLSGGNSYSTSITEAYSTDYVKVVSGSIYEVCGRDPNIPDNKGTSATNQSYSSIFFYADDYTFLGSYPVRNQTALIKAPFGAAYARMNIKLKQDVESGSYVLDTSNLTFKLYRNAIQNRYIVRLKTVLSDNSETQLLRDGQYKINLYISDRSAADNEDLTVLSYTPYGDSKVITVTDLDMPGGKLKIENILTMENLPANMAYKAELEIIPKEWNTDPVLMDTVYFTTNRTTYTIANAMDFYGIKDDPSGNYVVVADFEVNTSALDSTKPFTGTIDFQGHTITQTGATSIFYTISRQGTIKNMVMNYVPHNLNGTSYWSNETICDSNYGTIQNVIINYGPQNDNYPIEMYYSGGIAWYNYGTIDGFIFRFTKDVRVSYYFGAICYGNYGTVSNGYVCSEMIDTASGERRYAQLTHPYALNSDGTLFHSGYATRITYGVAANYSRATVKNVFILGDLVIESADATSELANSDLISTRDPSALDNAYDALLISGNDGTVQGCFTVGDRIDKDPNGNYAYMITRGPCITAIGGTYNISNVSYFSNAMVAYNEPIADTSISSGTRSSIDTLRTYNIKSDFTNLYDYEWYKNYLGEDGDRFRIRDVVEAGYYPTLILPDCMPSDEQPLIELPGKSAETIKLLSNDVRAQGTKEALVTVTLDFPGAEYGYTINDFRIVADGDSEELGVDILYQEDTEEGYRVDMLLVYPDSGKPKAVNQYRITSVSYTGNDNVALQTETGADTIAATFWRPVNNIYEWKQLVTNAGASENYWVTADLDFSKSLTWRDWFVNGDFKGRLNGGVYKDTTIILTNYKGEEITDVVGNPRAISAWGEMEDLRVISGVGNLRTTDQGEQVYDSGRDRSGWCACLINHPMGAIIENFIFSNFVSTDSCGNQSSTYSDGCGVIRYTGGNTILRNLHVRDSVMFTRAYGGALVARVTNGTVENCSARNVSITKLRFNEGTDTIYLGGLLGSAEYATVNGCFAADVIVDAQDVYASNGMGGLIGYMVGSNVSSCYSTGSVNGMTSKLGGLIGYMTYDGSVTGCWSTASVQTVSDYAGGLVGYHYSGVLANNYTASLVITRSLAATYVHRICDNVAFSETMRYGNYAFSNQYLTYVNTNPAPGEGIYQFGTWEQLDGASGLLKYEEVSKPSTWENMIEIGDYFDIQNVGVKAGISGNTTKTAISDGYYPKLLMADGKTLMYDQPDCKLMGDSSFNVRTIYVDEPKNTEEFTVRMVITSDIFGDYLKNEENIDTLALWDQMTIIGGQVKTGSLTDMHSYGTNGRAFQFNLQYGAAATDGHYLDSYIVSLPVYNPEKQQYELSMARVSLQNGAVYKEIDSIDEWDDFFSQPKYAQAYENIKIGWLSQEYVDRGKINFSGNTNYSNEHNGAHVTNVRINRICGEKDSISDNYPEICNLNVVYKAYSQSLINTVITAVNDISFRNIKMDSTGYSGQKGVIGELMGDIWNVNFEDITIIGGGSSYVGCIAFLTGEAKNIYLEDIDIQTNGYYVGGLVGYARTSCTIHDIHMTASDELFIDNDSYNIIDSQNYYYTGGIVGRLEGIAYDITVERTYVKGRYMVGGVVGYCQSNGGRPDSYKLENAIVGNPEEVSDTPGIVGKPNVVVELGYMNDLNGYRMYGGGVVGYGEGYRMNKLECYNVKVCMLTKPVEGRDALSTEAGDVDNDEVLVKRFYIYLGGVVGGSGNNTTYAYSKNVTVVGFAGWIGGVGGGDIGQNSTAKDTVVIGLGEDSSEIGGVVGGAGSVYRCYADHCVVIGNTYVGGLAGKLNYYYREDGVIDTVVIGKNHVGGMGGWAKYYQQLSNYVSCTMDADGNPTVSTTLTAEMLKPATSVAGHWSYIDTLVGKTFDGTYVKGTNDVGGLFGTYSSMYFFFSYVSKGVTVEGVNNVGGLCGYYNGWCNYNYQAYDRYIYNVACGAKVIGEKYVGGIIGQYGNSKFTDAYPAISNNTGNGLFAGRFYSILMTGDVEGKNADTCHLIVGGYSMNPSDNGVDNELQYCRVYEGSTLKVNATTKTAAQLYTSERAYDTIHAMAIADRVDCIKTLTVSANNLNDLNMYFGARNTRYMGMGWDRTYWNDEAVIQLYKQTGAPASFQTYKDGLARKSNLVLWYDAKNNTNKGYTDEETITWTDLSGKGNDATLIYANKQPDEPKTITEHIIYMRWNDGALEFPNGSTTYYAQLSKSISQYLQENYTVELIYDHMTGDADLSWGSVLSWYAKGYLGGFRSPYGSPTYNSHYVFYDLNNALTGQVSYNIQNVNGRYGSQRYRTDTWVMSERDMDGKATMTMYIDGVLDAQNTNTTFTFRNTDDITWRIGAGYASQNGLERILGIRVYNRALTPEEIEQNAEYDQWYYFGGSLPGTAIPQESSFTLNADGTVSGSYTAPLTLVKSDDGNYNGTLVSTNFQSGTALTSTGYYYCMDANGRYSTIVKVTKASFGPYVLTQNLNGEYWGMSPDRNVKYQEGTDGDINDRQYQGGYWIPTGYDVDRDRNPISSMLTTPMLTSFNLFSLTKENTLPKLNVYASGVDRVNIELDETAPAGLEYQIITSKGTVVEGNWPANSRTITMTWDFQTDFRVVITDGTQKREKEVGGLDVRNTVMTYGNHYWYLCEEECYGADNISYLSADIVHLMNGMALGKDGNIYSAESYTIVDTVTPFVRCETTALWSGSIKDQSIDTFGSYCVYGGAMKDQPIIVRGGYVHSIPGNDVRVGSFLANDYNGKQFTVFLTTGGTLVSAEDDITYPDEFVNSDIAEISCSVGYSGHMMLVRYESGKLIAFDYLNGKVTDTISVSEDESFFSFIKDDISTGKDDSMWSNGTEVTSAGKYQEEVESDPDLQEALKKLGNEENGTSEKDGTSETGIQTTKTDVEEVTDTSLTEEPGQNTEQGTPMDAVGVETKESEETEILSGNSTSGDGVPNGILKDQIGSNPDDTEMMVGDSTTDGTSQGDNGETDVSMKITDITEGYENINGQDSNSPMTSQYLTVYDSETGETRIYELSEFLNKTKDERISEEEKALKLEEMGFVTSLLAKIKSNSSEASGAVFMVTTMIIAIGLITVMVVIKNKKFDHQ